MRDGQLSEEDEGMTNKPTHIANPPLNGEKNSQTFTFTLYANFKGKKTSTKRLNSLLPFPTLAIVIRANEQHGATLPHSKMIYKNWRLQYHLNFTRLAVEWSQYQNAPFSACLIFKSTFLLEKLKEYYSSGTLNN